MAPSPTPSFLYVAPDLGRAALFTNAALADAIERHHLRVAAPPLGNVDVAAELLSRPDIEGVLLELAAGLPTDRQLDLLHAVLATGHRAWVYWPHEEAVECVDAERLVSLRQHVRRVRWLKRICVPIDNALIRWNRVPTALRWIYRGDFPVRRSDILVKLTLLTLRAQPLPLRDVLGDGVYLRCDYWKAGAADRRMCDVVRSLAKTGRQLVCLTATPDALPDEAGFRHAVMDRPGRTSGEDAIVLAPTHYGSIVKAACQALQPAFLYERLCAGQSAGAEISQALAIPYILEYAGPDALLREAMGGSPPFYPELYAQVDELALRQATMVIVESPAVRDAVVARGIDASRVMVIPLANEIARSMETKLEEQRQQPARAAVIDTGDAYKDQVQNQWNQNPVGSQHARASQPRSLEWFQEIERHRYGVYAPWMPEVMEFASHAGEDVLEIGGGIGTDLAQFASNGARVTDVDLAAGHLQLAEENFQLRGLSGRFMHRDAESLPFPDASFDLVYCNGVLHHTPNTRTVVQEIARVLRPGGRVIAMVYAENSFHYWRKQVWLFGIKAGSLDRMSMGEILSTTVERSANDAKPLVKVYSAARAAALFTRFEEVEMVQRQLEASELPPSLQWALPRLERRFGWNLIVKARKPR